MCSAPRTTALQAQGAAHVLDAVRARNSDAGAQKVAHLRSTEGSMQSSPFRSWGQVEGRSSDRRRAREFSDVIVFRTPPPPVQRALFAMLVPIARWRGYRATYPRLIHGARATDATAIVRSERGNGFPPARPLES